MYAQSIYILIQLSCAIYVCYCVTNDKQLRNAHKTCSLIVSKVKGVYMLIVCMGGIPKYISLRYLREYIVCCSTDWSSSIYGGVTLLSAVSQTHLLLHIHFCIMNTFYRPLSDNGVAVM